MWQSGGVLFLALKMSQESVEGLPRFFGYDVLPLDASDDFDRPTAATANLWVANSQFINNINELMFTAITVPFYTQP